MATYRVRVGRRHKVQPGSIVGAIANEGGLSRGDFGHIDIRGDHTLVELPADLSDQVFERLRNTRVSGQLIELRRDDSVPSDDDHPPAAAAAAAAAGAGAAGASARAGAGQGPRAKRLAKPADRGDRLSAKPRSAGKPEKFGGKPGKFAAKPERPSGKPEKFAAKPEKKRHRKGQSGPH
jgi:ATP-dependent RNA helicase DeaD